jgi:hypothetical protein
MVPFTVPGAWCLVPHAFIVTIPLAPRTVRAVDLAIGGRICQRLRLAGLRRLKRVLNTNP